jgi:ABC-type nitrate/sulfonate/bicarbonate transport system substrate-binding protein
VAGLSLLLLLAACAGDAEDDAAGDSATTGADCEGTDEVKIGFPGLPPDFVQMGLPMANHRGVLQDYCIVPDFIEVESGVAAFRAMAAGEFEFAYSGSVSPVLAKAEGADATVFMSPANQLDFQTVSLEGFDTCESLKGQSIATDGPGGLIHAVMEAFLENCGLDIDSDVRVQIGDPETFGQQLASETVVASAVHIDEKFFIEDEIGVTLNVLGSAWEFTPLFHYASLSTATSRLEEDHDLFVRISAAILESNRWLKDEANRDEAISAMAEVSEQPEEVIEKAIAEYGFRFPTTCAEALDPKAFQFLIDQQASLGNLPESYPAEDLVDQSVCTEAEAMVEERAAA